MTPQIEAHEHADNNSITEGTIRLTALECALLGAIFGLDGQLLGRDLVGDLDRLAGEIMPDPEDDGELGDLARARLDGIFYAMSELHRRIATVPPITLGELDALAHEAQLDVRPVEAAS